MKQLMEQMLMLEKKRNFGGKSKWVLYFYK